jgi:hypothetical protein
VIVGAQPLGSVDPRRIPKDAKPLLADFVVAASLSTIFVLTTTASFNNSIFCADFCVIADGLAIIHASYY